MMFGLYTIEAKKARKVITVTNCHNFSLRRTSQKSLGGAFFLSDLGADLGIVELCHEGQGSF
jgi:hypothetical protein